MRNTDGILADVRQKMDIIMAVDLKPLMDKRDKLRGEADDLLAVADAAGRDLTDDELTRVEGLTTQIEATNKRIDVVNRLQPTDALPVRRTAPEPTTTRTPAATRIPAQPLTGHGTHGFANFGEFATTVRRACVGEGDAQQRFLNAASTYGAEGVGGDGGFLVPPDFRAAIWEKVANEDSLLSRATPFVTANNSISFPKDETSPWQTSGGLQCAWDGEASTLTASKPVFQLDTMRLARLSALVPVTEELLEDAPAVESYLRAKVPAKMVSKINTAIVSGNGVGKPLGILNSASLVTVDAETSQDVATIVYANIINMWSRMYAPCRRNAIWLINQDCEPQLMNLAFRESAASPVPAYMPANGLSASPYSSLMGRPVVPIEACSTIGTAGDIMLVDMTQYMALTKGQQIKTDVSMHLYFDQALTTFRFIMRLNGGPLWTSSITPENGSMTRSWAVALATRP
jgi:HK97 family phage major capsid protein